MPVQTCRVCRAKFDGNAFVAREMMLGTRHPFEYWECGTCGSVQILDVPDNLDDYYPAEYFSFKPHHRLGRSRLRKFVDSRRVRHARGAKNWVGSIADRYLKPLDYLEWCSFAKVGPDAPIWDYIDAKFDEAFEQLRNHARNHNIKLGDLCDAVVNNGLRISKS